MNQQQLNKLYDEIARMRGDIARMESRVHTLEVQRASNQMEQMNAVAKRQILSPKRVVS